MSTKHFLYLIFKLLFVLSLFFCFSTANSSDNEDKNLMGLVSTCYSCHGTLGNAVGNMKSLNGYKPEKFVSKFNWFLKKPYNGGVMHTIAKGFTEKEIKVMANFFATQK